MLQNLTKQNTMHFLLIQDNNCNQPTSA